MNLFEVSISTAILIAGILLIRKIGEKSISKRMVMHLWNLVLIRALIPKKISIEHIPVLKIHSHPKFLPENLTDFIGMSAEAENLSRDLIEKGNGTNIYLQWQDIVMAIWLLGVMCFFLYFLSVGIKEFRELRQCTPCQNETAERMIRERSLGRKITLYEGNIFSAPVTCGVIHPKIVLPADLEFLSRMDMRNMIAHELIHIQRFDVAKRFIMITALCIHWFNPFLWIMYRYYREDQEMACDECVLSQMQRDQTKNYIHTMIKMTTAKRSLLTTNEFWGKNAEKKRIIEAMSPKRAGKKNVLAVAAFGVCFGITFFTANPSEKNPDTDYLEKGINSEILVSTPEDKMSALQILPIFEEREYRQQVDKDYDYLEAIRAVEENYNDFSQEPTKEQAYAAQVKGNILLAKSYKEKMEQGYEVSSEALWIIDEFYRYVESAEQ